MFKATLRVKDIVRANESITKCNPCLKNYHSKQGPKAHLANLISNY